MSGAGAVLYFEDLSVGQSAEIARTVGAADIDAFAAVSGDANPVHVDADYAATSLFGERVAHGMRAGAYISAVLGVKLPGPGAIYRTQSLKFRKPVKIGDTVTARVTVKELEARRGLVTLETLCLVGDQTVVEGEAVVVVPRRPAG
jgi:3-hydroxybutyryl-CoA dehydratase